MDLMRLYLEIWRIARRRQPTWRLVVIAVTVSLVAVMAGIEWAGYWPEWLRADRPRWPR